jgi:MerR family transcriptional regulator/heat shock protein HspR
MSIRRPGVFGLASSPGDRVRPSDLRLYEREGLLRPARTEGKTRLYDADTIDRLEIILTLTRDLGVNLAGVDVILHMKERMQKMQGDLQNVLSALRDEARARRSTSDRQFALVKVHRPAPLAKVNKS